MPTYEYACKSCGEHLEVVQSFKDDALTECPACGGDLRKVFGSIGISFKGSGFYKNDSRSSSSTASKAKTGTDGAKSDSSSSSTDSSKSDGKSESKPDKSKPDKATSAPSSSTAAAS